MGKGVAKLVEKARLDGRSWLYRWLYARYAELATVLNGGRPPWVAVARTIRDDPGWKGSQNGPSRQAVRDTWLRVQKDKAGSSRQPGATKRAATRPAPQKHAQGEPTPPLVPSTSSLPASDQDEPAPIREPRHKFGGKPATNRVKPKEAS